MLICVLQVQSLLIQLVKDPSQDVVDLAFDSLLTSILEWTSKTDLLHTSLLPAILSDMRGQVERYVNADPVAQCLVAGSVLFPSLLSTALWLPVLVTADLYWMPLAVWQVVCSAGDNISCSLHCILCHPKRRSLL